MREKILGLLGLMRRANAVSLGGDNAAEAIRGGKAKLLLFSSDVADNARRKIEHVAEGRNVELAALPFDREELGAATGLAGCSAVAVTDLGFARALSDLLAQAWPEQFADLAQRVRDRQEKAARRKSQKGSKRVGTRRTNV